MCATLCGERFIRRSHEHERDTTNAAQCGAMGRVAGGAGGQWADAGNFLPVTGIGLQHVWCLARAVAQECGRTSEADERGAARGVHLAAPGVARADASRQHTARGVGAGRRDGFAHWPALMFYPEGQLRVFLYGRPADMRQSFDGKRSF